jgi:glycerol-3-phosphate dehydrogenase
MPPVSTLMRLRAWPVCVPFTIHPRKGEEYLLDKRLQGFVKRVIFPCPTAVSKGILIIPTFDGTIMVGPTADDTEDKMDLTTSTAGAEAVFAQVSPTCTRHQPAGLYR